MSERTVTLHDHSTCSDDHYEGTTATKDKVSFEAKKPVPSFAHVDPADNLALEEIRNSEAWGLVICVINASAGSPSLRISRAMQHKRTSCCGTRSSRLCTVACRTLGKGLADVIGIDTAHCVGHVLYILVLSICHEDASDGLSPRAMQLTIASKAPAFPVAENIAPSRHALRRSQAQAFF
ncbi:hypothetical protein K431DRAFT_282527 [Polychaeton citri CBS 116435]|uniref:Uncharacterized protein n=1 Tax=Polychaeton citri CBS 116435 TaxID=1314669 RepID=A0A9P4QDT8_9PEZI|nr:hypothetical protein K431DRAFT_282527 [Polychaeton citri CBS 116435]